MTTCVWSWTKTRRPPQPPNEVFFMDMQMKYRLAILILSVSVMTPLSRAADGVTVAKSEVNSPVTITDNGPSWTLDNGIVKVTVNKTSGNFRSLIYRGMETMSAGGAWEQTP